MTEPQQPRPQKEPPRQPRVLTIAGSDSGGGAGIQADLKTFTAHSVYGTSVLTVVTAQNTHGVHGTHVLPPEFVTQQLDAVLSDIGTDAIKIGALANSEIIRVVSNGLRSHFPGVRAFNSNLVLDPVMVATSGDRLLQKESVRTMMNELFPITFILTPNVPEAELLLEEIAGAGRTGLTSTKIQSLDDMKAAAKRLANFGPCIVVLKGGHLPLVAGTSQIASGAVDGDSNVRLEVVDVIYDSRTETTTEVRRNFIQSRSTHGTGCTLSAAIASSLARGLEAHDAIVRAIDYVQAAIRQACPIGTGTGLTGHGPLNHSHALLRRAIELPTVHNPQPFMSHLLQKFAPEWKAYTHHPFLEALGNGSLPREHFIHYIKQDYLFLQNYARANGLGAFKCRTLPELEVYAKNVVTIAHETKLHVEFCAQWGVSYEELVATQESMANIAYTRYVLDIGSNGDVLDLSVALAPCLIGYGHIGQRLFCDTNTNTSTVRAGVARANPYWDWISIYGGENYQEGVRKGIQKLEEMFQAQNVTEPRLRNLEKIFMDGTRLETAFWEMGLQLS